MYNYLWAINSLVPAILSYDIVFTVYFYSCKHFLVFCYFSKSNTFSRCREIPFYWSPLVKSFESNEPQITCNLATKPHTFKIIKLQKLNKTFSLWFFLSDQKNFKHISCLLASDNGCFWFQECTWETTITWLYYIKIKIIES